MRFGSKSLGFVINFLLGVSWALMLIGAMTSFLSSYHTSFIFAVLSAAVGAIPGLIGVLLLEYFITDKEKLHELKKQTALLKELTKER